MHMKPRPMPYEAYQALYIHIPYCVSKCAYCDFESCAKDQDDPEIDGYIDNLVLDIRSASREGLLGSIKTVYIGGGTPSHIGLARLSKLLYTLSLSMHLEPGVECTMEANPESLDERMVRDIWALGVNRISLGVQSFDDEVLRILGRPHSAADAKRAIEATKTRFENVSIDLMCGIPGQSDESFIDSIRTALDLGVTHISVYPLIIEEGTAFQRRIDEGSLPYPDDDVEASHMEIASKILAEHGFERYEVASYALPGYESRHNTAYWTGLPYLGLGRGATSMRQSSQLRERIHNGEIVDSLDAQEMLAEDLMLGMRMSRGLSMEDIEAASLVFVKLPLLIEELRSLGLIEISHNRAKPTELGWLCGNELYGRFLDLVDD